MNKIYRMKISGYLREEGRDEEDAVENAASTLKKIEDEHSLTLWVREDEEVEFEGHVYEKNVEF